MPARYASVLVAALVLLSGCSMLPGGDGGGGAAGTPTETPPQHHELVLAASTTPFEAEVTVTKAGETLYEGTVSNDSGGTYHRLTELDEPGPYTVVVNTTIQQFDENRSARLEVDGDLGNATVLKVGQRGIFADVLPLPRRPMKHPLGAYSALFNPDGSETVDLAVRVWYQGDEVADASKRVKRDELTRVVELERTGVYRVSARTDDGRWVTRTVVVTSTDQFIRVKVDAQGRISGINARKARRWAEE